MQTSPDLLSHQQRLQLYGISVPSLEEYRNPNGVKTYREFRLQFSFLHTENDPVSMKLAARSATDTPYAFQDGILLYQNNELQFLDVAISQVPLPPEENTWHLKGFTFPFRGSKNPYAEMRINLKISGSCPGHCIFCHRTHSHRMGRQQRKIADINLLVTHVKSMEGEDIFKRISRIMFITELFGNEHYFLKALKETADALAGEGFPDTHDFNCCATDVRSVDGLKKLRELVRPNRFSFSLEFFHNREKWMGRYKGIPIEQLYRILENARQAGFEEIQLNYLAGIDTLEEVEQGFSTLSKYGLVDSIGLSTFVILAENQAECRLTSAWDVEYYQQLVEILNALHIKAYHPESFDMGCPYSALMEKVQ